MPAPSETWATIPTATDIDKSSPWDEPFADGLYDRMIYLKEILYGTGTYLIDDVDGIPWTDIGNPSPDDPITAAWLRGYVYNLEHMRRLMVRKNADGFSGDVPHDHTLAANGLAEPAELANFIRNACPNASSLAGNFKKWEGNGVTDPGSANLLQFAQAGDFIYQIVLLDPTFRSCFGEGVDCNVSLFAKSRGAQSDGSLSFGLSSGTSSGGTSAALDTTDFLAGDSPTSGRFDEGAQAALDFSDLGTSWVRYHCRLRDVLKRPGSEVRFIVRVNETFTESVLATGFQMTLSTALHPFSFSHVERGHTSGYSATNHEYRNAPTSAPASDWTIGMTNPIEVRPI